MAQKHISGDVDSEVRGFVSVLEKFFGEKFDFDPGSAQELLLKTPLDVLADCYKDTFIYDWPEIAKMTRQVSKNETIIVSNGASDGAIGLSGSQGCMLINDADIHYVPDRGHSIPPFAELQRLYCHIANQSRE